jgi:hypothetical protein
MPDDVMTRVNVTPERLRSWAIYRVIFYSDLGTIFEPVLSDAGPKPSSQSSDLRWGILFCDESGREVGAIFVDRFGGSGYVNKDTVVFRSDMAKRLHQIVRDLR